jgi:hypothetical protein
MIFIRTTTPTVIFDRHSSTVIYFFISSPLDLYQTALNQIPIFFFLLQNHAVMLFFMLVIQPSLVGPEKLQQIVFNNHNDGDMNINHNNNNNLNIIINNNNNISVFQLGK